MWLGRQWRRAREWFGCLSWPRRVMVLAAVLTSLCWCGGAWFWLSGFYVYWVLYTPEDREFVKTRREYREGLPSAARQLKTEMEAIPDPDTALEHHPDWAAVRFKNGEWVFGHGVNSHDLFQVGRGTAVVKDSRGQVRIFFGHVCGRNGPLEMFSSGLLRANTLEEFYHELQQPFADLREWVPD